MNPFTSNGLPSIEVETLTSLDLDVLSEFIIQMDRDKKKLISNASNAIRIDKDSISQFTGFRDNLKEEAKNTRTNDLQIVRSRKMHL